MPSQNNETLGPNESTSEVNNEVPSSRVKNGHYNRSRPSLSLRRRALIRAARRNTRRQRVQNGNTSNSTTDDDNDFHFFISLLPYLKDVPRHIRLRIRDKVQRVIIEQLEEYNNANNEGSSNDLNNRNLPSPSPSNHRSITPQEELPEERKVQDPIKHPLPVYPFIPYYNRVYGNVNNFVTPTLSQSSEYSFSEQQSISSYRGQQIYQPVPRLAGQLSLPAFAGQQSLPAFAGQQSLPAFAGQQSLPAFAGQQSLPAFARQQSSPAFAGQQYSSPFVGQQQYNMPYFARQQ